MTNKWIILKSWLGQPGDIWEVIKETDKMYFGRRDYVHEASNTNRRQERRLRKKDAILVANSPEDAEAFKVAYKAMHDEHSEPIKEVQLALNTLTEGRKLALQALTEDHDIRRVEERMRVGIPRMVAHYTAKKDDNPPPQPKPQEPFKKG